MGRTVKCFKVLFD